MLGETKRVETHRLRELLIKHEGLSLKPYRCTAGKLTIGVGRNLDAIGITRGEAMLLLSNDIDRVLKEATVHFPWFNSLCPARQDVVVSMIFNLGLDGFKKFKNTINAIQSGDFEKAASEMLSSKWADQVGDRDLELAKMMRQGTY